MMIQNVVAVDSSATRQVSVSLASLITTTLVLETSAQAVRDQIDALYRQLLLPSTSTTQQQLLLSDGAGSNHKHVPQQQRVVVLLHLGVDTSSQCFRLEHCAYNEATFRIPDEQGYEPKYQCILPHYSFGHVLTTPIDIPACLQQLEATATSATNDTKITGVCSQHHTTNGDNIIDAANENSSKVIVEQSTDPGRYVCNYLYCYSLAKFCPCTDDAIHLELDHQKEDINSTDMELHPTTRATSTNVLPVTTNDPDLRETGMGGESTLANTTTNNNSMVTSGDPMLSENQRVLVYPLFLHVPPFTARPKEEQLRFITQLMKCLYRQVRST